MFIWDGFLDFLVFWFLAIHVGRVFGSLVFWFLDLHGMVFWIFGFLDFWPKFQCVGGTVLVALVFGFGPNQRLEAPIIGFWVLAKDAEPPIFGFWFRAKKC